MTDCFNVHTDGELTVCNHGTVMIGTALLGIIAKDGDEYMMFHPEHETPADRDTLQGMIELDQLMLDLADRIGVPADNPKRKVFQEQIEDATRVLKAIEAYAAWCTSNNN